MALWKLCRFLYKFDAFLVTLRIALAFYLLECSVEAFLFLRAVIPEASFFL